MAQTRKYTDSINIEKEIAINELNQILIALKDNGSTHVELVSDIYNDMIIYAYHFAEETEQEESEREANERQRHQQVKIPYKKRG